MGIVLVADHKHRNDRCTCPQREDRRPGCDQVLVIEKSNSYAAMATVLISDEEDDFVATQGRKNVPHNMLERARWNKRLPQVLLISGIKAIAIRI